MIAFNSDACRWSLFLTYIDTDSGATCTVKQPSVHEMSLRHQCNFLSATIIGIWSVSYLDSCSSTMSPDNRLNLHFIYPHHPSNDVK